MGGGGGETPNVPTEKNNVHITYMQERAPQKHLGLHNFYTINCSSFYYLWHGAVNDIKINEYASEWAKFCAYSHSITAISFNILLVLQILCLRNMYIFRSQVTFTYIYNQYSFLSLLMVWRYIINEYSDKTLTLRKIYVDFRISTF